MSFDLAKIFQSKREFRQRLATRPIAEKLAMLDALRERQLAIRGAAPRSDSSSEVFRGSSAPHRIKSESNKPV